MNNLLINNSTAFCLEIPKEMLNKWNMCHFFRAANGPEWKWDHGVISMKDQGHGGEWAHLAAGSCIQVQYVTLMRTGQRICTTLSDIQI